MPDRSNTIPDGASDGDAATACNQITNMAPVVSKVTHAGAPPVMSGGTISDGTYFLSAMDKYNGMTGSGTHKEHWIISGNTVRAITTDTVSGMVDFRVAGTFTVSGNMLTVVFTCPMSITLNLPFTSTPTQIQTINNGDPNEMHTLTMQATSIDAGSDADAAPEAASIDAGSDANAAPEAADGGTLPLLIASGANNVYAMAVDETGVYWSDPGGIKSAPRTGIPDGGAGVELVSGESDIESIALRGNVVYFAKLAGGFVRSVSTSGGTVTNLLSGQQGARGLIVNDNGIFFANGNTNKVLTMPLAGLPDGGIPTTLATAPQPTQVRVDASRVYFSSYSNNHGHVGSAPLTGLPEGGTASLLIPAAAYNGTIPFYIDATSLYSLSENATSGVDIVKAPLSGLPEGGSPTVLVSGIPTYTFAMDDAFLYWSDNTAATMMKAPIAGLPNGQAATIVGPSDTQVVVMALDASYVYWSNQTQATIVRAPK